MSGKTTNRAKPARNGARKRYGVIPRRTRRVSDVRARTGSLRPRVADAGPLTVPPPSRKEVAQARGSWCLDGEPLVGGVLDGSVLEVLHRLLERGRTVPDGGQLLGIRGVHEVGERTPLERDVDLLRRLGRDLVRLLAAPELGREAGPLGIGQRGSRHGEEIGLATGKRERDPRVRVQPSREPL